MTAPDPGLTDLIAAALYSVLAKAAKSGTATVDDLVASVTPVVEQHTNGRIAELEAMRQADQKVLTIAVTAANRHKARAQKLGATIARVRAVEAEYLDPEDTDIECREDVWRFIRDLRAALEGE